MGPRTVLLCLGLGACGIEGSGGERAQAAADPNRTGDPCPADERCSPTTSLGLAFIGPKLVDDLPQIGSPEYFSKTLFADFGPPVRTWASGGTQELQIDRVLGESSQSPLTIPFGAEVGSNFGVLAQTPPKLLIRAHSSGSGLLRILEPSGALLLDRLPIAAAPVDRVRMAAYSPLASGRAGTALLAGTRGLVAIKLEDPSGTRLVDQSARLASLSPTVSSTPTSSWDVFLVGPVSGDRVPLQLNLGSGRGAAGAVTVVDRIDRWVWLDLRRNQPLGASLSSLSALICVYPEAHGLDVATVDLQLRTEDPSLQLTTTWMVGADSLPLPPGCVQAERSTAGASSLIAEVGGLSDRITLSFRGT